MSFALGYNTKVSEPLVVLTFDTLDGLDDKIDSLIEGKKGRVLEDTEGTYIFQAENKSVVLSSIINDKTSNPLADVEINMIKNLIKAIKS